MDADYSLFVAVVEAGSLSAAGRRLRISPAMVSKRLQRLEARLGARLIHRTTRRLALTERGARFHQDVTAILDAVRAAEARVSGGSGGLAGPLRISAPTSFGRLHIAPHLSRFLDAHPRVELEINLADGFSDLIADKIDLAVRITPAPEAALTAHRLATSRRILCAAPAYLARHGAPGSVAALAEHRLLAATGQLPWRLSGPDGAITVAGDSLVRTDSSEIVRELAMGGVGIALRSLWDVSAAIEDGRLVRVLADHEGSADVGIYAVHLPTPIAAPPRDAFIRFLAALFDPAPWEALPPIDR